MSRRPPTRPPALLALPSLNSSFAITIAAALLILVLLITGCSPEPAEVPGFTDGNLSAEAGSASTATSAAEDQDGQGESPPPAPVTGEVLLASAPPGWVESGTLISPVMRMAEFVPAKQSERAQQWEEATQLQEEATQLQEEAPGGEETASAKPADGEPAAEAASAWLDRVTIESQSGDPLPDPIEFVLSLSRDLARRCEGFSDFNIMSGLENNYATSVRLLICPRYKDQPLGEVLMMKAIQGREYFYTVTRGRRMPAFATDEQPLTAQTTAEWSAYLKAVGVCDPRRTEHPCPDSVNTFTLLRAD
jgi:hypothetical protein